MKKPIFTGANVAVVTPFDNTGAINYKELAKIIEYQIQNKTDGITVCGTTGETCTLTDKEHKDMIIFVVDQVAGRIPVIAGTGSNHTSYAIELSKFAEQSGADGLLCVTPYYNKTSQRGLIKHFETLADSVDLPCILYNIPSRTGICFTAESYFELSKHPNINGVKEASGDFSLIAKTISICGDNLNIWSGNDDQTVAIMALGGKGVVSVLSNVYPELTHNITSLCSNGDFMGATALQSQYLSLINDLFLEVNPIPVKSAMQMLGFNVGELRLPLYEISEPNREKLKNSMIKAGLKVV